MKFESVFSTLSRDDIHSDAMRKHDEGYRYVQLLAVNNYGTIDLVYSYMLDGKLVNEQVVGLEPGATVASITDIFIEAFVCENEIHDLFGISFDGLVIDFLGNFYHVANEAPMTIISPEQLEARNAAREKKEAGSGKKQASSKQDMEEKLANMDPEKAAKVKAAMEAKAKAEKAKADAALEEKLANMDPEKAAKVKAAMEAKAKKAAEDNKEA